MTLAPANPFTDNDGDSQMTADETGAPTTPPPNRLIPAELSPPDSQGGVALAQPTQPVSTDATAMPAVTPSASGANVNGKRPLESVDGSTTAMNSTTTPVVQSTAGNGNAGNSLGSAQTHPPQPKVHQPSGYSWTKPEDAPGYSWQNRKAQEEASRAWEQGIVNKDRSVGNRYGDPFEMADREAAMLKRTAAPRLEQTSA
ncbi:hypothetical protein BDV97DRAFT_23813 [Delphinella strobiligena]|nr:hypothetical protein BDV97DRAFT_23813 [Delphinella strobiligena]